jgi:phenylalanyl-tRNA synthetase beta chain
LIDAIIPGEITQPSPLATMPPGIQDIALIVDHSVAAADLQSALVEGAGPYLEKIELFDRYDKIGEGKISLAYTLTFRAPDRTLKAEEIADFRSSAVLVASKRYGAVLREG